MSRSWWLSADWVRWQLIAGAGQAADVSHRRDQPEMANLEIHTHEATSSSW